MRHTPLYRDGQDFVLDGRKIADNDQLSLRWPDGHTATSAVRIIGGELRIAGTTHGAKCWVVLNLRKVEAAWPDPS